MRINNEIKSDEFTEWKNTLLKEKAHFMDLLNDAQDRANTWLERADNLFSFAKTAKTRFKNGTITEKKEIIQALGSNLLLKDKSLPIKLSQPFEILEALSPEVMVLNCVFQPVLQGGLSSILGVEESKLEIWLGRKDSNPRMAGPKPAALPLGDSPIKEWWLLTKWPKYSAASPTFKASAIRSVLRGSGGMIRRV